MLHGSAGRLVLTPELRILVPEFFGKSPGQVITDRDST